MNARSPKDPTVLDEPWLRRLPLANGRRVLGSIVLLERLGAGAMGIVLRGWHIEHGREVAVKVLNPMLAVDSIYVGRFRREAKLAMRITHHNVVRVFDVRCDAKLHYIVMEYVPGESLRDRVERVGALSVEQATCVFAGIAAGLAEAHALGIVHRDIKPDNVMISSSGRAKLADLGLARQVVDETGATLVGQTALVMGTPQYMSPEQWETPDVKPPCDVWALGATFFFAATGQPAVPAGAPGPVARWIHENDLPALPAPGCVLPAALAAVHARCVHRESARRYRNAAALCDDLAGLQVAEESCLVGSAAEAVVAAEVPSATERLRLRGWLIRTREARRLRESIRGRRRTVVPRSKRMVRALLVTGACLLVAVGAAALLPRQSADASVRVGAAAARPLSDAAAALARGDGAAALLLLAKTAARRPGLVHEDSVARLWREAQAEMEVYWLDVMRRLLACDLPLDRDGSEVTIARRELSVRMDAWPEELVSLYCELRALPAASVAERPVVAPACVEPDVAARLVAPGDGAYELWLRIEDTLGGRHELALTTVCFDTRIPALTLARSDRGCVLARGTRVDVHSDEQLAQLQLVLGGHTIDAVGIGHDGLVWSCRDFWQLLPAGVTGRIAMVVRAVDAAGNVGRRSFDLHVDDQAPAVSGVRVPAVHEAAVLEMDGWAPNAVQVCVEVVAPDDVLELRLPVQASGRFCLVVPTPDTGVYRGRVVASDAAGNASEAVVFETFRRPGGHGRQGLTRVCADLPPASLRDACAGVQAVRAEVNGWLLRAQLWGLDQQFARAVRRGDRCAIEQSVKNMVLLQPNCGHELLLAVLLVSRGANRTREARQLVRAHDRALAQSRGEQSRAEQSRGEHVRERLAYLGLVEAARQCGVDLAAPGTWFDVGPMTRLRLMFPDHKNLQNRRAGLERAIARAAREMARQRDSWQRHDDKQRLMMRRSDAADRGSNGAYWRQQAVRHNQRKEVHARVMRSKQGDIDRHRQELAAIAQATLRMRSFSLGGRSSGQAGR